MVGKAFEQFRPFFIIMKKILLSMVLAIVSVTISFAQSSLLATLSHDGTVKTFYGAAALKSAHEAAVNGDVITLSAGTFQATDITKAVTVRGSGMSIDSLTNREPTVIAGDFSISVTDSTTERFTLEGIYHNNKITLGKLQNPMFLKCRFKEISCTSSSYSFVKNASFIHCKISTHLWLYEYDTASCINCVITYPSASGSNSMLEMVNCIIVTNHIASVKNGTLKNCFIEQQYSTDFQLSSTCTVLNNVGINSYGPTTNLNDLLFQNIPNKTNKKITNLSDFFKTYKGEWKDDENYELTDDAKTKYLGTDGTEIGINGGSLPFDETPTNPQITKCQVAAKSTADGKLSVDITIKAAE